MSGLHQTSEFREGADNVIYWTGVQFSSFGRIACPPDEMLLDL